MADNRSDEVVSRPSRRILNRLLLLALTLFSWGWAVEGVRSLHEEAFTSFGLDFYQFWLGADVVRHHPSGTKVDLVSPQAFKELGSRYLERARAHGGRQLLAASNRKVVETVSSPFFYWVFSIAQPDDYERAFDVYHVMSICALVGSIAVVTLRLGYPNWAMAVAIALATMSGPVFDEYNVVNIDSIELAVLVIYFLLRDQGRRSLTVSRGWFAASGVLMGLLVPFKPNFLILPFLVACGDLFSRRWRELLAEGVGFCIAFVAAIGISTWSFGGFSAWIAWAEYIHRLADGVAVPSTQENMSTTRFLYEATGHNFLIPLTLIAFTLALSAMWVGRRQKTGTHVDELRSVSDDERNIEFGHDLVILGLAGSITLICSGLAWLHYPVLIFPFLLLAAAPMSRGPANQTKRIIRYSLTLIAVAACMYPLAPDLQQLLPYHFKGDLSIWLHLSQLVLILVFGLSLWFECDLLQAPDRRLTAGKS